MTFRLKKQKQSPFNLTVGLQVTCTHVSHLPLCSDTSPAVEPPCSQPTAGNTLPGFPFQGPFPQFVAKLSVLTLQGSLLLSLILQLRTYVIWGSCISLLNSALDQKSLPLLKADYSTSCSGPVAGVHLIGMVPFRFFWCQHWC